MGWMKRWLWELIENGEVQYLITMGAPKWAIEEAEFYAKKDTTQREDGPLDDVKNPF